MSSKLALPPLTGMPPDVQAAFRAVAAWAKSSGATSGSDQKTALVQAPQQTQRVMVGSPGARPASSLSAFSPEVPTIKNESIIRSIFSNSALVEPIQLNASVVFQSGTSTTGVGIGAGGIIGKNNAYAYTGYEGYTFGISAADGSFFFGPQVNDPDPARKQIIFDVGTGVFQFGSDIVVKRSSGSLQTLEAIASSSGYTSADLQADLAAGVGNVLAGAGQDYRLTVSATNIVAAHKDVVFQGYSAAADAANTRRAALGLTANGIVMGYNDVNGNWVSSIAIDATTGSASFTGAINATSGNFTGTITAGSVITNSVTVDGTTLGTIRTGAAAGATAVQPAAIAGMLTASSSYVLAGVVDVTNNAGGMKTGTITWNSSTGVVNGGSGIAITPKGIVGAASGVTTFSVDGATGSAVFKGNITGASGTFGGSLSTSGQVYATGTTTGAVNAGIVADTTAIAGVCGKGATYGVYGTTSSLALSWGALGSGNTGVYGYTSTGSSSGVHGEHSTGTAGYGVRGTGSSSSQAVFVDGTLRWGAYTYAAPNGSASSFLRADGSWAAPTVSNADTVDGYHASSFPIFANALVNSGYSVAGKTAYWAAFSVAGTTYNFLVADYP